MPSATATPNELTILRRVVEPGQPFLSTEAAQAIVRLDFGAADRDRVNELAARNREGQLTDDEDEELPCYIRVGQILGILQSKARRTLRPRGKSRSSKA